DKIAKNLSTDWLMSIVDEGRHEGGLDSHPFGAIDLLLYHLSHGPQGLSVVREFLLKYESEIELFPSSLVRRCADLAVHWLNKGKPVGIHSPRGSGWSNITRDLKT